MLNPAKPPQIVLNSFCEHQRKAPPIQYSMVKTQRELKFFLAPTVDVAPYERRASPVKWTRLIGINALTNRFLLLCRRQAADVFDLHGNLYMTVHQLKGLTIAGEIKRCSQGGMPIYNGMKRRKQLFW